MQSATLVRRAAIGGMAGILMLTASVATSSSSSANTLAVPAAPTGVVAAATTNGITVAWSPVTATPAVTHYVISGGPGTCPVTVPASTRQFTVPAIFGQAAATWSVQAVNPMGISPAASSPAATAPSVNYGYYVAGGDLATPAATDDAPSLPSLGANLVDVATDERASTVFSLAAEGTVRITGVTTLASRKKTNITDAVSIVPLRDGSGYYVIGRSGRVAAVGAATKTANAKASASPVVGAALTASGKGLWLVRQNGVINALGDAPAATLSRSTRPVIAVAAHPGGQGLWAIRGNGAIQPAGAVPAIRGNAKLSNAVDAIAASNGQALRVLTSAGRVITVGTALTSPAETRFPGATQIFSAEITAAYKPVQVLNFSDLHGYIEGTSSQIGGAKLAAAFDADRGRVAATIATSSGDNIGASPAISALLDEKPTIEALNGVKLDVSTFGNHEHDRPLSHLREMIDLSSFEWVVSNYSSLDGVKGAKNAAKAYTIVIKDGVRIGVVGMNTPETPKVIFPGNLTHNGTDIAIASTVASTQAAVDAATAAGADLVIGLIHDGWNANDNGKPVGRLIDIASQLKGVAAVFGGHSHQRFASYVGDVFTAQAANYGTMYNRTQLCVNTQTKQVVGASYEAVLASALANVTADAALTTKINAFKAQLAPFLDAKIGTINEVIVRGGADQPERRDEHGIGILAADAMRERYDTDFALINGGGIRASLPSSYTPTATGLTRPATGVTGPYDVVLGDAYTIFPFGNAVGLTTVTGSGLWSALEHGVGAWETFSGRFPQISGFTFAFDPSKPAGSRVTEVKKLDGTAIAKDSTVYTIATVDFLAYGGDGYTQFDPKNTVYRELLLDVLVDRLKEDLAAGRATTVTIDDRITVID